MKLIIHFKYEIIKILVFLFIFVFSLFFVLTEQDSYYDKGDAENSSSDNTKYINNIK